MKNTDQWVPTKYIFRNQKLIGSRNPARLSISSRLMTDITASFYQHYIPLHIRGSLADLGCGNVPFYQVYKNYVTDNTCVDWVNTGHKNNYLDMECDLNGKLPLNDSSFDSIILSEVLEHIASPEIIWSEMARILRKNGKILLSVPFLYKIHEAPYDYYRYTEFALKNLAEKNGFRIIEMRAFGGLPEVLADIVAKNFVKIPFLGSFCSRLTQYFCKLFVSTSFGKKISQKTSVAYPLGYFMITEKM